MRCIAPEYNAIPFQQISIGKDTDDASQYICDAIPDIGISVGHIMLMYLICDTIERRRYDSEYHDHLEAAVYGQAFEGSEEQYRQDSISRKVQKLVNVGNVRHIFGRRVGGLDIDQKAIAQGY